MKKYKQVLGRKGEQLTLGFLRRKGYRIIARNFYCRFGEIDIIAHHGKSTVFIEVKTRGSEEFGRPEETIKLKKIRHLWRAAQFYIKNYAHPEGDFRFDVVAIIFASPPQIYLIENAF